MKKTLFFILALFTCIGLFAQNVTLDQAVESSAKIIESRLPQGAKVAVLVFTSSAQSFSDYILDEIATAISAGRKIQVIDRQHTDAIRRELNIQMQGDVSDNEVRRVGHQLGAQYVVTGSLVDIGNAYRFRVAAIDVETAVREGSSSLNININDPQVVFLLTGQRPNQKGNTLNNTETKPSSSITSPTSINNPFIGKWKATKSFHSSTGDLTYIFDLRNDGSIIFERYEFGETNDRDRKLSYHKRTTRVSGRYTFFFEGERFRADIYLTKDSWGAFPEQFKTIYLSANNQNRFQVNLFTNLKRVVRTRVFSENDVTKTPSESSLEFNRIQ